MPETVTGSVGSSIVGQCTSPKDDDLVTGASVKVALQAIEDDIKTIGAGKVNSANLTRVVAQHWIRVPKGATKNDCTLTADGDGWADADAVGTGPGFCEMFLSLPHGQQLTAITVLINPAAHAAMPAGKPVVRLDDGTTQWETEDPETDPAVYSLTHAIFIDSGSTSPLPTTINRTDRRYRLQVFGEYGANALDLQVCANVTVNLTVTSHDTALI